MAKGFVAIILGATFASVIVFGGLYRAHAQPPANTQTGPQISAEPPAQPSVQPAGHPVPAQVAAQLIGPSPAVDPLETFRKLYNEGKATEAFKNLEKVYGNEKNPELKGKMAFGLGLVAFQQSNPGKAAEYFNAALQFKTRLDDYAQYYLGVIERDLKNWNGARQHFEAVKNHQPASVREADAEIELVRIAIDREKWAEAFQLLLHLERKHRHEAQYPDILYNLVEVALVNHHPVDACRAAVHLYTRYASYSLGKGWGFDLDKVKAGKNYLRCRVGTREREKRIQQLLIAGEFDQIRTELKDWVGVIREDPKPHPDDMGRIEQQYGQLSLTEGKIKDAISHLLTSQDMMGRNFTTQMLLAKAYSQTDDYPSAVEGYMKAYELSPRSKLGQKALFQAAFLSYQNRDYDGASRRFEMVVRKTRGAFVLDAKWHLAWIRYLKSDYEGAKREFQELSRDRRYSKSADLEKLQYWRAMSEFRDGNVDMARALFTDLSQRKRLGYYTGASLARLSEIPGPTVTPGSPGIQIKPMAGTPFGPPPSNAAGSGNPSVAIPSASASPSGLSPLNGTTQEAVSRKPSNSDEGLGGDKDSPDKGDEDESESLSPLMEGPNELPPGPNITALKNPSLVARFGRAQDLIDLGFSSWAGLELREIEKRTSNRGYLQALMDEYLKAGDFYRSAYIADVIFEMQRERAGIEGATMLWGFAFPQAYSRWVGQYGRKFDVTPTLVWSVMRGESGFREDIHSTAGAMGLMQLIPPTAKNVAKELGLGDFKNHMLLSPETNIMLGTKYLRRLLKVMQNSLPLAIASYNAGPHRVQGWLKDFGDLDMDEFVEHIPYLETRNYVKKVLRNYFVYQSLYERKQNPLKVLAQKVTIKFSGPKPTSESWDN